MTDDSSALHRLRSKAQQPEDLAAIGMLGGHLRAIAKQEQRLAALVESADLMVNTTFATQAFDNFSRAKDVEAVRLNYKNLLTHEARKARDAALATEYTEGLAARNKDAAARLQARRNEREYWRQLVLALRETDAARQQTHAALDTERRALRTQIADVRAELEKRVSARAAIKAAVAALQLQLLELQADAAAD